MKRKKEQNILTVIIILAILALVILIGSIIYENEIEDDIKEQEKEEYVGEEEQETQKEDATIQNNDEKAIDLAKKEWGEDDTVTFNVEEKNGTKYYVAVKQDATVIAWYEVDTENWKISEY